MSEKSILIYGEMFEMNMIEITDDVIQKLTKPKDNQDSLWDDLEEVYDQIMGDSLINGFTFNNDDANFSVYVNNERQIELSKTFIDSLEENSLELNKESKMTAHFLIYEQWSKNGSISLTLDEDDFDLDNLELPIEAKSLPDGTIRRVVVPYYDGEDFEFEGSTSSDIHLYIIKSDGSRINL